MIRKIYIPVKPTKVRFNVDLGFLLSGSSETMGACYPIYTEETCGRVKKDKKHQKDEARLYENNPFRFLSGSDPIDHLETVAQEPR